MVSVLFVMPNSVYNSFTDLDIWDQKRNAINWPGGNSGIFHPPCRSWGNFKGLAQPDPGEKWLFLWSIIQVRKWGGVVEHPRNSSGWVKYCLDARNNPGNLDKYGGWYLDVNQHWWGHKAEKKTGLYIVGIAPKEVPAYSIPFNAVTHTICRSSGKRHNNKKEVSKYMRSATPPKFAAWLIEIAEKCNGFKA